MSLNRGIYILWLMCLLVFNHTHGQQVNISIQSTGYPPHLYRDKAITVTCKTSGGTVASVLLVNGTEVTDTSYGCGNNGVFWTVNGAASGFPGLTVIDNPYCATAGAQSPPFTLSLKGHVSDAMEGFNLNCLAVLDGSLVWSADTLTISEIRVVPPGPPTLTISGDEPKIAERTPFTFTCSPSTASPGAQPASQYSYEVLRYDGMTVASTSTYTPKKEDSNGITLKCTDTVHYDALKNMYPERVVKETDLLLPWYLVNKGENITTQLNPTADNTLTCDVSGYPEDNIAYSWTCDGCTSTDTSKAVVPKDSRTSGKVETISCTASLPTLTPVTITWNITWYENAPLPTEGPDGIEPVDGGGDNDDNKVLSAGAIAGIVVGVFIACGCSGGVVVVIYKRKNKPSRQREASATAQADGKVTTDKTRASAPPGGTGMA